MKTFWQLREEMNKNEITVGNYTTTHFHMCGSAIKAMKKHSDVDGAEELTRMQDDFYKFEKQFLNKEPSDSDKQKAQSMYDNIMDKAKAAGIEKDIGSYMKMHRDSIVKGKPKPGFGRVDTQENPMKTYWQIKETIEAARSVLDEELTMMSHGGEQTHIISGMKHNQRDADKAKHATIHATAKHAGVHADKIKKHHETMSNVMGDDHHYMRHEPVKKGTKSDDKAGRGGHGDVHHHKDLASYVKHHAKNDAEEYKNRHHYYEEE